MDDMSRKFKSIDWKGLQKQAKKVQASTASALKDLVMTDLENKVRAATGDTNWGASGADLAEIAQGTYNREDFTLIMSILWQRLASTRWRCVYKALDVLKYMVLHGAARVFEETRDALPHIRRLEHFSFTDPVTRRDEGANVRARASNFVAILSDDGLLEEERTKSAALRAKIGIAVPSSHYTAGAGAGGGLSSDDYRFGAASSRQQNSYNDHGHTNNNEQQHYSGGYDDVPPPRQPSMENKSSFNGFGDTGNSTPANNATVDDLLGGFDSVPALPAPPPSGGLEDLMGASPPIAPTSNGNVNGLSNINNSMNSLPGAASFYAPAQQQDDDDEDEFGAFSGPAVSNSPNTGPMSTSRLVANLAAAQISAKDENSAAAVTPLSVMKANAEEEQAKANMKPKEDTAYGGIVHFENIMLDKNTRVESKQIISSANTKTPTTNSAAKVDVPTATGVEVDPFGDLLSTAKKSGVL